MKKILLYRKKSSNIITNIITNILTLMTSNSIIIAGYKVNIPNQYHEIDDFLEKFLGHNAQLKKPNADFSLLVVDRDYDSSDTNDYGIYIAQNIACLSQDEIITQENKNKLMAVLQSVPKKSPINLVTRAKKCGCMVSPFNIFSDYYDVDRGFTEYCVD